MNREEIDNLFRIAAEGKAAQEKLNDIVDEIYKLMSKESKLFETKLEKLVGHKWYSYKNKGSYGGFVVSFSIDTDKKLTINGDHNYEDGNFTIYDLDSNWIYLDSVALNAEIARYFDNIYQKCVEEIESANKKKEAAERLQFEQLKKKFEQV